MMDRAGCNALKIHDFQGKKINVIYKDLFSRVARKQEFDKRSCDF